jgi:hypothetical protein
MEISPVSVEDMPEVTDSPKTMSTADFYQLVHEQIDTENSSMNQRVNWMIVSQSFFFSAFTTLLSSPPQAEDGRYAEMHAALLWIIPGISLVTSLLIYVGILISLIYMADLRKLFQAYPQDNTTEHFPPIQGATIARRLAYLPAIAVPLLFIGTWAVLLIQEVR